MSVGRAFGPAPRTIEGMNINPSGVVDLGSLAKPAPTTGDSAGAGATAEVTEATFAATVERSREYPVILTLTSPRTPAAAELRATLERLASEYAGKFFLAEVDVDAHPQIAQVFQVQAIPTTVAVIAGQPVPLFQGAHPIEQVRQVIDQVLQMAVQNGVVGTAPAPEGAPAPEDEAGSAPELPPHHAAGLAALEAGDLDTAEAEYRAAIKENPGDSEAKAALLQVEWMRRTGGSDPAAVIAAAVDGDVDSQLAAADAELATGNLTAAFERLLGVVRAGGDGREPARARLVEYFTMIGSTPEVTAARRQLAAALY